MKYECKKCPSYLNGICLSVQHEQIECKQYFDCAIKNSLANLAQIENSLTGEKRQTLQDVAISLLDEFEVIQLQENEVTECL